MSQHIIRLILLAAAFFLAAFPAHADSWEPPEEQTYLSADGEVRLTVTPRDIASPLAYFDDKVEGREPAGVRRSGNVEPRGLLERRGADGRWTTIWEARLVNEVAPVSALVAGSGEHVVTFDNWHSIGHGDDAVVIYGPGGAVVRALGLDDLMPVNYVAALPASPSSINWGGEHRLSEDQTRLILEIVIAGDDRSSRRNPQHVNLALRLTDGFVIEPRDPAWEAALSRAGMVVAERNEAERARLQALVTPLLAPVSSDIGDWNHYLREASVRNDPDWPKGFAGVTVLFPREHERHGESVEWAREALLDWHYKGESLTFGSPSPDALTTVLTRLAGEIPPSALNGVHLFVAAGDQDSAAIAAALAHSGANYIQINPAVPIPPRPEWLSGEAPRIIAEAAEAEMEELMSEFDALDEPAEDGSDSRWDAVAASPDDLDEGADEPPLAEPR